MRTRIDIILEQQEREAWAAEYARADAEYNATQTPTVRSRVERQTRAVLEASEALWRTGKE